MLFNWSVLKRLIRIFLLVVLRIRIIAIFFILGVIQVIVIIVLVSILVRHALIVIRCLTQRRMRTMNQIWNFVLVPLTSIRLEVQWVV